MLVSVTSSVTWHMCWFGQSRCPPPAQRVGLSFGKPVAVLQRSLPVSWRWNPAHPPSHGPRDLGHAGASRVNAGFQKQGPLTVALRVTERRRKEYIIYFSTGKSASPTGVKLPVSIDSLFLLFPLPLALHTESPQGSPAHPSLKPPLQHPGDLCRVRFPGILGPFSFSR